MFFFSLVFFFFLNVVGVGFQEGCFYLQNIFSYICVFVVVVMLCGILVFACGISCVRLALIMDPPQKQKHNIILCILRLQKYLKHYQLIGFSFSTLHIISSFVLENHVV